MPKLTIDGREIEVDRGTTILNSAQQLGIHIPTLCFKDGCEPSTSCMVCVVKVNGKLVPSCATMVEDGMNVESETDEVREARCSALELLLSDHVGDCTAPCQITCPAGMNIPLMIRQIAFERLNDAIITVKADIALPAILGRICPAPCENACRRGSHDNPVSICLLKRYVADVDLMSASPYLPSRKPPNDKKVAIIGAGATGLSTAYYLLQEGFECIIFDEHEKPGGGLRNGVPENRLPRGVLDDEIGIIRKLGAEFRMNVRIGGDVSIDDLRRDYDAVMIAVGEVKEDDAGRFGVQASSSGIKVDRNTLQTNIEGVFAGGNAIRRSGKMAVRSVADGKTSAVAISQYLSGLSVTGIAKSFTVRMGRLMDGEMETFLKCASDDQRIEPSGGEVNGFSDDEAREEALRCLHCDCRKADNCKLRDYAEEYEANSGRYKDERRLFEQHIQHPDIIYEPGKCIDCGLCIQIASKAGESLGLTFIGRGFNVRIGVPFNRGIDEGLKKVSGECVSACPTGALAFKSP